MLSRRDLLFGLGAASFLPYPSGAVAAHVRELTRVDRRWLVSEKEANQWHAAKDEKGPALTGNASWRQFMTFLENKLGEYGCVDIQRSPWTFTRLESSTWPDDSQWSLAVEGRRVALSNFGANCGLTGPSGVTAPLVLWNPENKPEVAGKIVVFRPAPRPEVRAGFSDSDYEYATPFDSYPLEAKPVPQAQDGTHSIAAAVWDEMTSTSTFIRDIASLRPAGVVFALNLNEAGSAGLHTFPVPDHYDFPSVYADRRNGDSLIEDARAHRSATLRVEGKHVQSEAWQLVACLPGKDYGTGKDQRIQLRTHTDGPSISQDNGALGLLGMIKYMSRIPRRDRPRTLLVELDCRHFMPGAERRWEQQDYFKKHPQARDRVVALLAMEHLGQIEYVADGDDIKPSGRSLPTWIYASGDQRMIDEAYQAAVRNDVRSAIIRSPGRPGRHGRSQGPWYGMSRQGSLLGLPTYGVQGDLGAYWAFSGRMNRFDVRSFIRQVATFIELCGFLMTADIAALHAPRVEHVTPPAFR
ncbi:MAG TPA: hypothetical protein VGE08_08470 [Steroidobacter sp.]|uniref:hypothetical protein n=1 Tax=Steroidobacter sp. TaxID=1978227 RepID=UPI002ED879BD